MKKLFILFTFLSLKLAAAPMAKDTTIVEFDDKSSNSKIKVITGKKTLELPRILNLESILKAVGVDSSERKKAIVLVNKGSGKNDTLFVLSQEGQKIKIITKEMKKDTSARTVIKKVPDATDSSTEEELEIDKDRDANIADELSKNEEQDMDYDQKKPSKKSQKFFSRSDFGLYLGINGFRNTNDNSELEDLRTWKSRYLALSFRKNVTLIKGKSADLAFSYGPEIAWYNFMLQNSNVARYENGQVSFVANTKATEKSKLVVPYLNFPVLLNMGFKEDKFKIGIGGYIGYRVGGYTKEKFASGGKNKTEGSFGLEKPIYGLTAEIGKKGGFTLFGRYDMSNLFKSNQVNAKDIQAFSVGVRL